MFKLLKEREEAEANDEITETEVPKINIMINDKDTTNQSEDTNSNENSNKEDAKLEPPSEKPNFEPPKERPNSSTRGITRKS